jgi:hypothetical protein
MTRRQLLNEVDPAIKDPLAAALDELSELRIAALLSEGRRALLTQCLYALQGRLGEIPFADLEWACKQAGIRAPGTGKITWTLRSRHIDGRAVDIVPVRNGTALWTYAGNEAAHNAIAAVMKKHGFKWGGDWKEKDWQHYEM